MQVSEADLYGKFIDRTLTEVEHGLFLDSEQKGSNKRKVYDALIERKKTKRCAAQKTIEGRFILGGDDASYLASGMACIWSTVGAKMEESVLTDRELELAPSSLYAPDSTNGIRQGLLKALERRNEEMKNDAPNRVPILLQLLATVVTYVPNVPDETVTLLKSGKVDNREKQKLLLTFLRNLKRIIDDADGLTNDPERNLAHIIFTASNTGPKESIDRLNREKITELKAKLEEVKTELERSKQVHGETLDTTNKLQQEFEETSQELENCKQFVREKFPDLGYEEYQPDPLEGNYTDSLGFFSKSVVFRGMVGQRGPTESVSHTCEHDSLLPYTLPLLDEFVRRMEPVRNFINSTSDPTVSEMDEALRTCDEICLDSNAPKRQKDAKFGTAPESVAVVAEAMSSFSNNFALLGNHPVEELDEGRHGVEIPYEVRWMPQGKRAEPMARVAVLEHAMARCLQIANRSHTADNVAGALLRAAAALKFKQMEELYQLNEAVEFDDDPHPLGTDVRLVTRPCAVVRGTLSYPTDPGVQRIPPGLGQVNALSEGLTLANAMGKTSTATATLRNDLRREGFPSHFYVAPPVDQLAFVPAAFPIGAPVDVAGTSPSVANERLSPCDYSTETWKRVVNRAIVAATSLSFDEPNTDSVSAFLEINKSTRDGAGELTVQMRRDGLWSEMQRNLAISQDRLWVFIRLVSGCIGNDVTEVITMADAATIKAAKAIQDQRIEVSRRVSDMQAKIVETVVSSMLKNSNMTLQYENNSLAVIDAEAKSNLKDLASGTSGRPFFEANVALKNLVETGASAPPLKEVLAGLANVGTQMRNSLEQTLVDPDGSSASLVELSEPSNSYFVSLRADAVAAIRSAHQLINNELGALGGQRRLSLWELVEGGCDTLTHRFAEVCSYLLVQSRSSTGVSALYVSHVSIQTNALQARNALTKLVSVSKIYISRVKTPEFTASDTHAARCGAIAAAEKITDISVTSNQPSFSRRAMHAPISNTGWTNVGGRGY